MFFGLFYTRKEHRKVLQELKYNLHFLIHQIETEAWQRGQQHQFYPLEMARQAKLKADAIWYEEYKKKDLRADCSCGGTGGSHKPGATVHVQEERQEEAEKATGM